MRKQRMVGVMVGRSREIVLAVVSVVLLAGVVMVSSAGAVTPAGGYAVFAQCPTHEAGVNGCVYSPLESGELTIGRASVPVVNTMVLQGGLLKEAEPFVKVLAGAVNGETLTAVPQNVPGGLFGSSCKEITSRPLRRVCEGVLGSRLNDLSAITELAVPASSIVFNTAFEHLGFGTALTLPVKVRLQNALLGHECYIGSDTDPITLDLTTGPAVGGPTGAPGVISTKEEGGILALNGTSLVSNTFAVPAATGCGPFGLFDSLIDGEVGLPSPAGANTVVLNGRVEIANSEIVEESESTSTPPSGSSHEHPGQPREKWGHTGEEWEHAPGAPGRHR
jgi:hypothetical protein